MNGAADTVALLEGLCDLAPDALDHSGVVAAYPRSGVGEAKVDVLPVRGVDADGVDLDQNVVVAEARDGHFLDGSEGLFGEYDRLGGGSEG